MDLSFIKLIVFDVDGVLTDGTIIVDDKGIESKHFYVRDGFGIRLAQHMGLKVAAMSGRCSRSTTLRLAELDVHPVLQGVHDKRAGLATICKHASVTPPQCAFVGDDLIDLPAMLESGYAIAVADAVEQVKSAAKFVTTAPGGRGAAREAIEHILKNQGQWEAVLERWC